MEWFSESHSLARRLYLSIDATTHRHKIRDLKAILTSMRQQFKQMLGAKISFLFFSFLSAGPDCSSSVASPFKLETDLVSSNGCPLELFFSCDWHPSGVPSPAFFSFSFSASAPSSLLAPPHLTLSIGLANCCAACSEESYGSSITFHLFSSEIWRVAKKRILQIFLCLSKGNLP